MEFKTVKCKNYKGIKVNYEVSDELLEILSCNSVSNKLIRKSIISDINKLSKAIDHELAK